MDRPTSPTIPAGRFKAQCLELMDRVGRTGNGIVITKRGKPVARLIPYVEPRKSLAGFGTRKVEISGDILSPLGLDWAARWPWPR